MDRITAALVALARAIPGLSDVTVFTYAASAHVCFSTKTDEAARALAAGLGVALELSVIPTAQWLDGSKETDSIRVTVSGPHYRRQPVAELDAEAVDAAVEQANAAIDGAS